MNSLMDVLEEVNRLDYAEFDNPPEHRFSRRSRKAMKKLLRSGTRSVVRSEMQSMAQSEIQSAAYSEAQSVAQSGAAQRSINWSRIPVRKRIVLVLLIVLLAAIGGTAGAVAIYGFKQERHREYTILRTVNADNCPKTIETVYYLPEIPEGYELYKENSGKRSIYIAYINHNTNISMVFEQIVKERYKGYFDTERQDFEELDINGHYALYLDFSDSEHDSGVIVWDNGDYILKINGSFNKSKLVELAKSVIILDN